jgi:outer membrane protein assembly factor BamE
MRALVCAASIALMLGGCSWFSSVAVYKLDINQGNYISQDMVDKLKVGQTRQQVRLVLGTPLVVSVFRDDRWDYVYEFMRQGRVVEQRTFTVYFVDEKLARCPLLSPLSVAPLLAEAIQRIHQGASVSSLFV